jgi:hypothetical protein
MGTTFGKKSMTFAIEARCIKNEGFWHARPTIETAIDTSVIVLNESQLPEAIPLISICDSCSDTMFRFAGSLGLRSLQVEFQADNPVRSDKNFRRAKWQCCNFGGLT